MIFVLPALNTSAGSLSGGNQQKVIVAREFSRPIKFLVASQPTRGLDVGSIEYIHKRLIQKRDEGCAVLLVSTELDEVMQLVDRIAVVYRGKVLDILDAKTATKELVGLLMAGIIPSEEEKKELSFQEKTDSDYLKGIENKWKNLRKTKRNLLQYFGMSFREVIFSLFFWPVFTGIILGGVLVAITTTEVYDAFKVSFLSGLGTALKTAWNTYVALFTGSVGNPEKIRLAFSSGDPLAIRQSNKSIF